MKQAFLRTIAVSVMLLAAAPAMAQQTATGPRPATTSAEGSETGGTASPRHAAAQAAGYRALHLCTATFSSGLPEGIINRTGSGRSAAGGETVIDSEAKTVSVRFAEDMEPRIAAWRPALGCTQLPIGATMEMVKSLPRIPASVKIPDMDAQPWPLGDAGATVELPAKQKAAVSAVLDEAFRNQEGAYKGNTWGVVVIKDGKIDMYRVNMQMTFEIDAPAEPADNGKKKKKK